MVQLETGSDAWMRTAAPLGTTGRSYFYAMEFVEGETLRNLIKRTGTLEVMLALEIATQVTAGLAAIHEQNLVHRDIKPTNILVRLKGEEGSVTVKIIDLGLAKTLDESVSEVRISSPGAFAGTPEFASPEQLPRRPLRFRTPEHEKSLSTCTGCGPARSLRRSRSLCFPHSETLLQLGQYRMPARALLSFRCIELTSLTAGLRRDVLPSDSHLGR